VIIDAQVHVWADDSPERPWPPGARDLPFVHRLGHALGVSEVIKEMNGARVDAAVIVPPSFAGDANDVVRDGVLACPGRIIAFGRISLDPPLGDAAVRAEVRRSRLSGFRLAFNTDQLRRQLADGSADWLWRACERLGLPVMVLAAGMAAELAAIARAHPRLRIAVDHLNLGGPSPDGHTLLSEARQLNDLADCPNVSVKASALPNYLPAGTPLHELAPAVYWAVERFGPGRVFWGSDLSRLRVRYADWLNFFRDGLTELTPGERALVLGDGLARWINQEGNGNDA
jgi:predicted TIM-barrel fold metal-dependent hydrolase